MGRSQANGSLIWLSIVALAGCASGPAVTPSLAVQSPRAPASAGPALATDDAASASPAPTGAAPSLPSSPGPTPSVTIQLAIRELTVPAGSRPHDVSPATDGGIWYTAQSSGELGHIDLVTG
jgi:virginiamycin B lyase